MESVLNQLEQFKNWKDMLRASCKNNGISTSLTGQLTILKARSLYKRFEKTYQKQSEKNKYCWGENQLKAFHWILITVSALKNRKVSQFTQNDWNLMSQIFKFKQMSVLQYQSQKLLNSKNRKVIKWTNQQQLLLIKTIQQQGQNNRWNQVGRSLYWNSDKQYFRTGKQCRQRWFNHLDPKKKHGMWTIQQDLKLIQLTDLQNRKWAKIVKSFHGQRTQHMIKNRFKSLLVKQKKFTPHIKKQEKLIQKLKQNLKNNNYFSKNQQQQQQLQLQDNQQVQMDSQQQHQQNNNENMINQNQNQVEQDQFKEQIENEKQLNVLKVKLPTATVDIKKGFQTVQPQNNNQFQQLRNSQKYNQNIDPIISNYFQQASQTNKNIHYSSGGFKIYSPFCYYPMNNNLTPTGLTPTLFSPNAFYVNSFTQNMVLFQQCLNDSQNYQNKKN